MLREEVTEADVAEIISKWTGIPVARLAASEREKLLNLGDELRRESPADMFALSGRVQRLPLQPSCWPGRVAS